MVSAILGLVVPAILGVMAGIWRLFSHPKTVVENLNTYALYFAFPALVARGLARADFVFPAEPGFWLLVPLVFGSSVAMVRLFWPRHSGTLALCLAFGNVAYLGLPLVERVLPERVFPLASLVVAVHIVIGVSLGPLLLLRWSGRESSVSDSLRRLGKQPLLWAPVAGLSSHLLPPTWQGALLDLVTPLGASAAPVALFLLGFYIHSHRRELSRIDVYDALHVGAKLLLLPSLTVSVAWGASQQGWITGDQAKVFVLLSAMPAAITTFALSQELGVGQTRTSRVIVVSTLCSVLTLPLMAVTAVSIPWVR